MNHSYLSEIVENFTLKYIHKKTKKTNSCYESMTYWNQKCLFDVVGKVFIEKRHLVDSKTSHHLINIQWLKFFILVWIKYIFNGNTCFKGLSRSIDSFKEFCSRGDMIYAALPTNHQNIWETREIVGKVFIGKRHLVNSTPSCQL